MVVQLQRPTTEGQRSQGGASCSLGGRDETRSLSSSKRRWIPPSALRRDALTQDNQYDSTFRKIRGFLNKLTPENFDKLSRELLNVGLHTRAELGGLILLIFQKALDEPKYCSMYAQLCKRLSENAPNFDLPNTPCTFNRLLIQKCQEEFERRRCSNEENGRASGLPDEEDYRQTSRRKMVGNLRFIGELGKLEIIHKSILHDCIEELLDKTRRSTGDLAEDLECLCQIMRTSGRTLDIPEAKNLMNQYFARIRRLSTSLELTSRIRFMLQDVLELRAAGWRPRKIAQLDGPRTIAEVHEQAARDLGFYIPPPNLMTSSHVYSGLVSPLSNLPAFFPQGGVGPRTGMDDMFAYPMGGAGSGLGTGPGVISSQPDKFGPYDISNGYHGGGGGMMGGGGRSGDGGFNSRNNRPLMQGNPFPQQNSYYQNKHFTNSFNRQQGGGSSQQGGYNSSASKEIPPRFKRLFVEGGVGGGGVGGGGLGGLKGSIGGGGGNGSIGIGSGGGGPNSGSGGGIGGGVGGGGGGGGVNRDPREVSLRPANASAGSMTLKPKTPALLPQSALYVGRSQNNSGSDMKVNDRTPLVPHYPVVSAQPPNQKPASMAPPVMLHKEPPLIIKQLPADKAKQNKKEKSATREEYMRRVRSVVEMLQSSTTKQGKDANKDSNNKDAYEKKSTLAPTGTNGDKNSITDGEKNTDTDSGKAGTGAATNGVSNIGAERVDAARTAFKDIKLPDRLLADAAHTIIVATLKLDESGRESGAQLLVRLRADGLITQDKLWDGFKQVLSEVEATVSESPRGKGRLAEVLAQLVMASTLTLSDLAEPMQAGNHFPLFLLILQQLHKLVGKQMLNTMFNDSKVNLLNLLPESERTKEKLSDILEDRQLSFLFPLLRIQAELCIALKRDASPHAFFKHIKDTLDVKHHVAPAFISALVAVLLKYITQESTLAKGVDTTVNPDKIQTEREKEYLSRYTAVLQAFLHAHNNLQIIAIYALQVYTYTNNFPKGMLLRWFMNLYDLEIIEEEAFLAWKEDVNDDYPGKGRALFQVNQWLTWLQETEEDEEEDEDEGEA